MEFLLDVGLTAVLLVIVVVVVTSANGEGFVLYMVDVQREGKPYIPGCKYSVTMTASGIPATTIPIMTPMTRIGVICFLHVSDGLKHWNMHAFSAHIAY